MKHLILAGLIVLGVFWTAQVRGEPVSGVLPGETRFDSQSYFMGEAGKFIVSPFVLDPAEIVRVDLRLFYPTASGRLEEVAWIKTYYQQPLYVPANEYFPIEIEFNVSSSGVILSGPVYYMTVVDLRRAESTYYVGYYSMTSLAFRVENPDVPEYSQLLYEVDQLQNENTQFRSEVDQLEKDVANLEARSQLVLALAGLAIGSAAFTVLALIVLRYRSARKPSLNQSQSGLLGEVLSSSRL